MSELFLNPWSSLYGYLDGSRRDVFVDYQLVPAEYGGDIGRGINAFRKQLIADIAEGLEVKGDVFTQSILGDGDFIQWARETFVGE